MSQATEGVQLVAVLGFVGRFASVAAAPAPGANPSSAVVAEVADGGRVSAVLTRHREPSRLGGVLGGARWPCHLPFGGRGSDCRLSGRRFHRWFYGGVSKGRGRRWWGSRGPPVGAIVSPARGGVDEIEDAEETEAGEFPDSSEHGELPSGRASTGVRVTGPGRLPGASLCSAQKIPLGAAACLPRRSR